MLSISSSLSALLAGLQNSQILIGIQQLQLILFSSQNITRVWAAVIALQMKPWWHILASLLAEKWPQIQYGRVRSILKMWSVLVAVVLYNLKIPFQEASLQFLYEPYHHLISFRIPHSKAYSVKRLWHTNISSMQNIPLLTTLFSCHTSGNESKIIYWRARKTLKVHKSLQQAYEQGKRTFHIH